MEIVKVMPQERVQLSTIGHFVDALVPQVVTGLIVKRFGACHAKNTGAHQETQ